MVASAVASWYCFRSQFFCLRAVLYVHFVVRPCSLSVDYLCLIFICICITFVYLCARVRLVAPPRRIHIFGVSSKRSRCER